MSNSIAGVKNTALKDFCLLNSLQLSDSQPIFCARIVYYDISTKNRQEVITYADDRLPLSQCSIDYLRTEEWLVDYPPVLSITPINIDNLSPFTYICPLGYRNQQPEYIQVMSSAPLSESLQQYLRNSATIVK